MLLRLYCLSSALFRTRHLLLPSAHTFYKSYWLKWTNTGFSQGNLESWFGSQLPGMLSTKVRCRYSLLLDPTLCRNLTYHGMVVLSTLPQPWPSVCNLPPPPGGHHFSLADTGHQLCAPLLSNGFIGRMSLLTNPLATNQ